MLDSSLGDPHPLKEKLCMRTGVAAYATFVGFNDLGKELLDRGDNSIAGRDILGTFEGERLLADVCQVIFIGTLSPIEKLPLLLVFFRVGISVLDELLRFGNLKVGLVLLYLEIVAVESSPLLEGDLH